MFVEYFLFGVREWDKLQEEIIHKQKPYFAWVVSHLWCSNILSSFLDNGRRVLKHNGALPKIRIVHIEGG